MAAVTNTTKTTNFSVTVKELDFISRFEQTWQALQEILGIMRPIRQQPGTRLVASKASIVLADGNVAEGDEIPLSQANVVPVTYADIDLLKYRKRVTMEAVKKFGAAIAVQKTDDALLNEITGNIMDEFYEFAQTGTLTGTEDTFQMAVSMAVTRAKNKFKISHLNYGNVVAFVNDIDVGRYLGAAQISTQTRNGIEYLKDFLGANTVILSAEIPQGTIVATPADNIVLYYIDPADGDFKALGLDYTTGNGVTNLIGVHKEGVYGRASGDTFAIVGLKLFAEYIDGISVIKFGAES
jgi:hypothetical protein